MSKKHFVSLAIIFILGCMIMIFASVSKKHRTKIEWNGTTYSIENVNSVDAKFARPYNKVLDKLGDGFVVLSFFVACLLILISFVSAKDKSYAFKSAFFDSYTFCVCIFYANGIYRILKTLAGRIRP